MTTTHEAEQIDHWLRGLGRPWQPAPGDRFLVPGRDLDDVFVLERTPTGYAVRVADGASYRGADPEAAYVAAVLALADHPPL